MSQKKIKLYQECLAIIEDKITTLRSVLEKLAQAKARETKSSAGDKFETGRAMLQREEEQNGRQLLNALEQRDQLDKVGRIMSGKTVGPGSLVTTEQRNYYVAIGLGRVTMRGKTYFCISAASPIGQAMLGKKKGESILFNGKEDKILKVE